MIIGRSLSFVLNIPSLVGFEMTTIGLQATISISCVTEEIFTLLTINNYNVVETGGVIDFTLILGNHVDSYLYGLLSVTNGWYRGSLTKLVLF